MTLRMLNDVDCVHVVMLQRALTRRHQWAARLQHNTSTCRSLPSVRIQTLKPRTRVSAHCSRWGSCCVTNCYVVMYCVIIIMCLWQTSDWSVWRGVWALRKRRQPCWGWNSSQLGRMSMARYFSVTWGEPHTLTYFSVSLMFWWWLSMS